MKHIREALFHLYLNIESFSLHILHLLFDGCYAFLKNRWVKDASIREHGAHLTSLHHARLSTRRSSPCEGVLLLNHDLLELLNLCFYSIAASFSVLVEQLHVVELLVERNHHLKHHATVVVEDVLLDTSARLVTSSVLVHDVVDNFAHLLLVVL